MPRVAATGLIFNPEASAAARASLDIHFEPAMIVSARKLDKLGLDIRSTREPLRRCVKLVIIPSIRKNFDVGGRDPKWPALAASTLKQKAALGYSSDKLIRTGSLRRQMGYIKLWTIQDNLAYLKDLPESIWYGKVHQAGYGGSITSVLRNTATGKTTTITESADGGIPQRQFVVLRTRDVQQMQRIFNEWLGERIAKARLR